MNAADERVIALSREVSGWPVTPDERRAIRSRLTTQWKTNGVMASIVFFALTSLAVAAWFGLCALTNVPKGWATAIPAIVVAELLIRRFHFAGTGVESALWTGGLFAWIFGLKSEGRPEGLLLMAAACAIAGMRVRNPLITSGAAIFSICYLGAKDWYVAALISGIAVAAAALLLAVREWQRPSTEILLIILMLVTPVTGAVWSSDHTSVFWAGAYLALAAAAFTAGIRLRHRGMLIVAAVPAVIAGVVARDLFRFLPLESKFILGGTALFTVSVMISRALRGRSRGFVMTPVKSALEDALRVFGSAALAPRSQEVVHPQPVGGGGSFGGAGSSGTF